VQIQYQGPAKDFSWIVPTPTQPTLKVGTERLFQALRNNTRPTFQVEMERTEGECGAEDFMMATRAGPTMVGGAEAKGVTVVEEKPVGPFDTAILQANDSAVLKQWLTDNEYVVPPAVDPLLDPYVAGKYYFIALKLRKDRDAGDMQPITFTYAATKPGIPIRLTGVAATPDMGVFVWVFGKHRAVPDNYRHAAINEARIDWFGQGGNYAQVVTEAMNEAGGQAFVTDYAGSNSVIDAAAFDPAPLETLINELAGISDPVAFTRRVLENSFQLQQTPGIGIGRPFPGGGGDDKAIAFLKRHVPKPSTLDTLSDESFYRGIEQYAAALAAAQVSVNGKRVEAELLETVVEPAREISEKLKSHPYLTRLYTTMSPEEMTQDPTFVFNPDAETMSNVHVAKGVRLCSANYNTFNAPVELTLQNGLKFVVQPQGGGFRPLPAPSSDEVISMPAALRIEQYTTTGVANVITNLQEEVQTTLTRLSRSATALGMNASGAPVSIGVTVPRTSTPATTGKATSSGSSSSGRVNGPATTSGFGCSGCSNPNRSADGDAGDGLALGLFGVGMLSWRFWSRKRR